MKHNFAVALALSALILTCGCKKSIKPDSVDLGTKAKAGFVTNPDWQTPSTFGRLIRYDIGDGNGSDCLLAWDILSGEVSLTQINSTNSTTMYQSNAGFHLTNGSNISVTQYDGDCSDAYNEIGGVHIIPYDANGTGHEDHLLIYIPGHGILYLIHYLAGGIWQLDWQSTSGIGGYDLAGGNKADKIISYDYGAGVKNYLICYRPGNKFVWIMKNNSTASNPNPSSWTWSTYLQSNNGIGGYDMGDIRDLLVTVGGPSNGSMNLCAFRPGLGYVWLISHDPNSSFDPVFPGGTYSRTSRSGLPGFSFASQQDRIVSTNLNFGTGTGPEEDAAVICYRPGSGLGASEMEEWNSVNNALSSFGIPSGLNYPMNHNPYGSPANYVGDHILTFSGYGGVQNNSLLFYSNGGYNQSQLYYLNSSGSYYQVY